MGLQVQPQDLERVFEAAGGKENPKGFLAGVLGFSEGEAEAGVPTWAWMLVALGAGVVVGKLAKERGIL